jgi:hypothetical protein
MDPAKVNNWLGEIVDRVNMIKADIEPPKSNVIKLRPGDDVQRAVDTTLEGSTITLEPGEYKLNLKTKHKNRLPITIRSSVDPSNFANRKNKFGHVDYEMREAMPTLIPSNPYDYAIQGLEGSANYIFQNIHIPPVPMVDRTIIGIGSDSASDPSTQPQNYGIFGCILGADDPMAKGHRAIELNCGKTAVIENFIAGIAEVGRDAQAICGWNGSGPFQVYHNFLQASGENLIFGGGRCMHPDRAPRGLHMRGNHSHKNPEWRNLLVEVRVKNHLQFKHMSDAIVEENLYENNWRDGQTGHAWLFKCVNDKETNPDGTLASWQKTHNNIIRNNVVRKSIGFVSINNSEGEGPTQGVKGLYIEGNLAYDMNTTFLEDGGDPRAFLIGGGPRDVRISSNAAIFPMNSNAFLVFHSGGLVEPFTMMKNILAEGQYGIKAVGMGLAALREYSPNGIFESNLIRMGGVRKIDYGAINAKTDVPWQEIFNPVTKEINPAFAQYGPDMRLLKERIAF